MPLSTIMRMGGPAPPVPERFKRMHSDAGAERFEAIDDGLADARHMGDRPL
jgi:hypothetical protein